MTVAEILDELVGHYAYDTGSHDSGAHDSVRLAELVTAWRDALKDEYTYRVKEAQWFKENYLSDKALAQGYGVEDVVSFYRWLEDR